jgi:hypothetical protein
MSNRIKRAASSLAARVAGAATLVLSWPALSYAHCHNSATDPASYAEATEDSHTVVYFRTEPRNIPLGEFFSLELTVCQEATQWQGSLAIDATMPAHGHGMNYQSQVTPIEGGFRADGFLFHMPGQWRLDFNLQGDAGSHHIYSFIDVR